MPRERLAVTLVSCLAACSPSEFVWQEADSELQDYSASFHAAAGGQLVASMDRVALLGTLATERVLWLGDHHRSVRLHGLQARLLDELQQGGVRLAFALEAVGEQDEPALQRHLRGESTLDQLRAQMRARWSGSWLDDTDLDPAHYRGLLTFARQHSLPVVPLEPTPRLPIAERDNVIAAAVRAAAAAHPDRLLVVHVGQAHLLGLGDLVARAGLGGFVLGGEPAELLRANAPPLPPRGSVWRSDGGVWWFAEVFEPRNQSTRD